jgi:hypothetical protein
VSAEIITLLTKYLVDGFTPLELVDLLRGVRVEVNVLLSLFKNAGIDVSSVPTAEQCDSTKALALCSDPFPAWITSLKDQGKFTPGDVREFKNKVEHLKTIAEHFLREAALMDQLYSTAAADALAALRHVPEKEHVPRLIQAIVEALKKEEDTSIQRRAARAMGRIMDLLSSRTPNTNGKRAKILSTMLASDANSTPQLATHTPSQLTDGILTVVIQAEREEQAKKKRKRQAKPLLSDAGSDSDEGDIVADIDLDEATQSSSISSTVPRR